MVCSSTLRTSCTTYFTRCVENSDRQQPRNNNTHQPASTRAPFSLPSPFRFSFTLCRPLRHSRALPATLPRNPAEAGRRCGGTSSPKTWLSGSISPPLYGLTTPSTPQVKSESERERHRERERERERETDRQREREREREREEQGSDPGHLGHSSFSILTLHGPHRLYHGTAFATVFSTVVSTVVLFYHCKVPGQDPLLWFQGKAPSSCSQGSPPTECSLTSQHRTTLPTRC